MLELSKRCHTRSTAAGQDRSHEDTADRRALAVHRNHASQYFEKQSKAKRMGRITPRGAEYLVVYPFVKTRPWYALPLQERGAAMREHAEVGSRFVTITNHTTYSFGLDDQEFMTVFECDEPADFMFLMQTLRETEASKYTERDTPIFVGTHCTARTALDLLDGAAASVRATAAH